MHSLRLRTLETILYLAVIGTLGVSEKKLPCWFYKECRLGTHGVLLVCLVDKLPAVFCLSS